MQGLFEAIAQFGDETFGTGDYVFDQCDLAAETFAGSAQNLADNYWTYVCAYPFTDVDQNGDPYSEGFTGRARIGNQGARVELRVRVHVSNMGKKTGGSPCYYRNNPQGLLPQLFSQARSLSS